MIVGHHGCPSHGGVFQSRLRGPTYSQWIGCIGHTHEANCVLFATESEISLKRREKPLFACEIRIFAQEGAVAARPRFRERIEADETSGARESRPRSSPNADPHAKNRKAKINFGVVSGAPRQFA